MKEFFMKNKVLLLGLMSAIAVAITPFVQNGDPGQVVKWSAVGFAVLIATLSYLGNAWRGQGMTLLGLLGNGFATAGSLLVQGSHTDPGLFILQLVIQTFIAISMAAQPDPKSRGYENSPTIREAKKEGEEIQPAKLTAKPK